MPEIPLPSVTDGILRKRVAEGRRLLPFFALFTMASLVIQWRSGAFLADRGLTNDEAAHFVTSLFLLDFISHGSWQNPLASALDYYKHFPRVAIGHWPPVFHLLQSFFFLIFGRGVASALALQSLIAGLATAIPAAIAQARWGRLAGISAGAIVLLSPKFLFLINAVMLDNLTGLLVLLSALAWGRYWQDRSWFWASIFSVTAVLAIMTKGNAIGIACLPLIHCALSRDCRILRSTKTWTAGAFVFAVTAPWYVLTYKMSSDGFVYSWGLDFTGKALSAYSSASVDAVGIPALLGFLGLVAAMGLRKTSDRDPVLVALASAAISIFLFQCIAPADLQPRYLIAALPSAAPLCIGGLSVMARRLTNRVRWPGISADAAVATLVLLSIASVFQPPHSSSFQMDRIAEDVVKSRAPNPLVLVCGSARAEGALIAAFAADEAKPVHDILRGFKSLASGNFAGSDYKMRMDSAESLGRWLSKHQVGWLVIDMSPESLAWPHNRLVLEMVEAGTLGLEKRSEYHTSEGVVRLYALPSVNNAPENLDLLRDTLPNRVAL